MYVSIISFGEQVWSRCLLMGWSIITNRMGRGGEGGGGGTSPGSFGMCTYLSRNHRWDFRKWVGWTARLDFPLASCSIFFFKLHTWHESFWMAMTNLRRVQTVCRRFFFRKAEWLSYITAGGGWSGWEGECTYHSFFFFRGEARKKITNKKKIKKWNSCIYTYTYEVKHEKM